MISNTKLTSILFMHAAFLVYCLYPVLGKFATRYELLSFPFMSLYFVVFAVLAVYALLWQQVLKHMSLTFAFTNKPITIIYALIWGALIFHEHITLKMVIGALVILAGIVIGVSGHD